MQTVSVKLLPDSSGRVRIHWFQTHKDGPITMPSSLVQTGMGPIQLGGAKGRLACKPELTSIVPSATRGVIETTIHSDDVRAATCPECLATEAAKQKLAELNATLNTAPQA